MQNDFIKALAPAMTRDNRADGDYIGDDGMLYCGKCNTRKQCYFEAPGLIPKTVVPCTCKCEQEAEKAREEERKHQEAMKWVKSARQRGLADDQYWKYTFAEDDGADKKTSEFCHKYVDDWAWALENNAGIMFYGDVGGGKTFFAGCIANAIIDKGVAVMMTSIPRLMNEMGKDYGNQRGDILNQVARVPLLILDDVGSERNTSYSVEQVYEIINTRYKSGKPLIVTTNLSMATIKDAEDIGYRRIYERLVEMCAPFKVIATGRRQATARAKLTAIYERFGVK